jgi:hypothetical protein
METILFHRKTAFYLFLSAQVLLTKGISQPLVYIEPAKLPKSNHNDSTLSAKPLSMKDSLIESKDVPYLVDKDPIRFNLGITYNLFTQKGVFGEFVYNNIYAMQLQHLSYSEFQGILSNEVDSPIEEYGFTGANFGAYTKNGRTKLGAFGGVGLLNGTARGDFLRSEGPGFCAYSCDNSTTHYYQEIQLNEMAFSLKVVFGLYAKHFGISLSGQIFFLDNVVLSNTSLNFEFGNM